MFALEFSIGEPRTIDLVAYLIALATPLIEFWLIIAVITGRNDQLKLRYRLVRLLSASIFFYLVGQIYGAAYEVDALDWFWHTDLTMEPVQLFIFKARIARIYEAWFNIIATFGLGASLLFWTVMRKRLGLDQSPNPSTI